MQRISLDIQLTGHRWGLGVGGSKDLEETVANLQSLAAMRPQCTRQWRAGAARQLPFDFNRAANHINLSQRNPQTKFNQDRSHNTFLVLYCNTADSPCMLSMCSTIGGDGPS